MDILFGQTQVSLVLVQTDDDAISALVWPGILVATNRRMKLVPKVIFGPDKQTGTVGWPGNN